MHMSDFCSGPNLSERDDALRTTGALIQSLLADRKYCGGFVKFGILDFVELWRIKVWGFGP